MFNRLIKRGGMILSMVIKGWAPLAGTCRGEKLTVHTTGVELKFYSYINLNLNPSLMYIIKTILLAYIG